MHTHTTIIRQPLLAGLLISIAAHGWVLHRGVLSSATSPPLPRLEAGRTVLQLTLLPSQPASAPEVEASLPPVAESRPEDLPAAPPPQPEAQPESQPMVAEPLPLREEEPASPTVQTESLPNTEENMGVVSEASPASDFHPVYPRISRQRGEEGTVTLAVVVLSTGRPASVEVIQSSGYRRLDSAAIDGAMNTRFTPAQARGKSVDSTIALTYTFRLTDG